MIDGPTLGKVFLGQVKTWDDAALKKLNPNVKLPSQAIAVVHRSDGSGTTFNFTDYLSKVSPDWKSKVGTATAVEWPMGIGAKGNEGVANNVANTKGSIGYVEYAYAKQNKMSYAKMVNKDGKTVAPTSVAFQAAAANADWNSVPGYGVILGNQPGAKSWPMTAATFILIHKQPQDPAAAAEALKFFAWAYSKGDKMAEDLDFVPMPTPVVAADRENVDRQHQGQGRQADVCALQLRRDPSNQAGGAIGRLPTSLPSIVCGRISGAFRTRALSTEVGGSGLSHDASAG